MSGAGNGLMHRDFSRFAHMRFIASFRTAPITLSMRKLRVATLNVKIWKSSASTSSSCLELFKPFFSHRNRLFEQFNQFATSVVKLSRCLFFRKRQPVRKKGLNSSRQELKHCTASTSPADKLWGAQTQRSPASKKGATRGSSSRQKRG